jgi:hypothetical protein
MEGRVTRSDDTDRESEQPSGAPPRLDERTAQDLAERAVDEAGGPRMIYRNPRHPFSMQPTRVFTVDGHAVEVRWGEISSPAVASVAGWVFEIHEEGLELLIRPPRPRPPSTG